jgi:hypothetical protein
MGMPPHSTKAWYLPTRSLAKERSDQIHPSMKLRRDQASDERKPLGGVSDRMMLMGQ